jgi:hypothetical protein
MQDVSQLSSSGLSQQDIFKSKFTPAQLKCFENVKSFYLDQDNNDWTQQISTKGFQQFRSQPPGQDVVQFKVITSVQAPIEVCLECATNFEVRKKWDNVLYDFKVFEQSDDYSYIRMTYSVHAPFPVTDRDFYLE